MRLWLRVALVVAVVSVASLLFTGLVAVKIASESATTTAIHAQERDATAVAETVGRWLKAQADFLSGWAAAFPVGDLDQARQEGFVRAVLKAIPSSVVVVLVDGDGQLVRDASLQSSAGEQTQRLIDRAPVTEAFQNANGTAIGAPFLDRGKSLVPIAVVASDDPPLLLVAEIALDVAAELRIRTTPDHAVVLVDGNNRAMVGGDHSLLDLHLLSPVLRTFASVRYRLGDVDIRGEVSLVPGTDWSVVVLEPEQVALEGATRIRRLLPLVVGVAMVLAVVLGVVLAQSVTEPIATLRDSALALADGRLGQTAQVRRSDEVGELARAFNHMSKKLLDNQHEIRRQRDEIEAFNVELRRKVEAATSELRAAQEQLVRSGQLAAVAQIGAGLAHELNNPLTAVLGLAQLVAARAESDRDQADLKALAEEAARCRDVVSAWVKFSTEQDVEEPRRSIEVRVLLDDIVGAVGAAVRRRGVRLSWETPDSVEVIVAPARFVRGISQLMTALASGLGSGSHLEVKLIRGEQYVMFQFYSDSSVGDAHDDWMISGLDLWVARQSLDRLGCELIEPLDDDGPWQVRIPRAL